MQLLSTEHETFFDPGDSATRGRRFAEEAEKYFEKEKDQPSIPLLQGQFAMFVYEGNVGAGSKSIDYLMRAMKTYETLNDIKFLDPKVQGKSEARLQGEKEGLSWVMWGLYCAEWQVLVDPAKASANMKQARIAGFRFPKTDSEATHTKALA